MLKKLKLSAEDWVTNHKKRVSQVEGIPKKLTMCKKCYTFYYKNSWHFDRPLYVELNHEDEIPVRFTECPACLEQESATYEIESDLVWRRS